MHRFWFEVQQRQFELQQVSAQAMVEFSPTKIKDPSSDTDYRPFLPLSLCAFFGSGDDWWAPAWKRFKEQCHRQLQEADPNLYEEYLDPLFDALSRHGIRSELPAELSEISPP